HSIEMQERHLRLHQLTALHYKPFFTYYSHILLASALQEAPGQLTRDINIKDAGQYLQLAQGSDRLQSRNDRYCNTNLPAFIHEIEILFIIEEHLCGNIPCSRIYLLLQVMQIQVHISRFAMLFRVASHAYAEISGALIERLLFQVMALVQVA